MNLCVIGPGYVGLVTAACFAEMGNNVICVGKDKDIIKMLNKGILHIHEPGLEELVRHNLKDGRLQFTHSLEQGIKSALMVFIAVGTPSNSDGSCNIEQVFKVAEEIGRSMDGYRIVAIKSTVPVGTAKCVEDIIKKELSLRGLNTKFDVISNPEFLKEGDAISDFMKPDRIIIGTSNESVAKIMRELYSPFARSRDKLMVMDQYSAEMTKYAANCMLATKISFINEIANICEMVGADVNLVRKGIAADHRIGYHFTYPGVGFGGSCLPKDLSALIHIATEHGFEPKLLNAVKAINEKQKTILAERIIAYFQEKGGILGKRIAIWGLSFKPNTSDMREAPSIGIISKLIDAGARISAYDPIAIPTAREIFGHKISYAPDAYKALRGAYALALITEWNEFRYPDFERIASLMAERVIFDGRNLYNSYELKNRGFIYFGIGQK